jgi:hypothetical protein
VTALVCAQGLAADRTPRNVASAPVYEMLDDEMQHLEFVPMLVLVLVLVLVRHGWGRRVKRMACSAV